MILNLLLSIKDFLYSDKALLYNGLSPLRQDSKLELKRLEKLHSFTFFKLLCISLCLKSSATRSIEIKNSNPSSASSIALSLDFFSSSFNRILSFLSSTRFLFFKSFAGI